MRKGLYQWQIKRPDNKNIHPVYAMNALIEEVYNILDKWLFDYTANNVMSNNLLESYMYSWFWQQSIDSGHWLSSLQYGIRYLFTDKLFAKLFSWRNTEKYAYFEGYLSYAKSQIHECPQSDF